MYRKTKVLACVAALAASPVFADEVAYRIDPTHTYPSFEADHLGLSVWRGKFDRNSGLLTFDKARGTGTVTIAVDMSSVDFGLDVLNRWAQGVEFFDVMKFSQTIYQGRFSGFKPGEEPRVTGELTLHGVTRPVDLKVNFFKCMQHPIEKRDWCGADALATINRDEFGLGIGKEYGLGMQVTLRIQVEAIAVR